MPEILSYMEECPFPFIILVDVNAFPGTLSGALRQWSELGTTSDYLFACPWKVGCGMPAAWQWRKGELVETDCGS